MAEENLAYATRGLILVHQLPVCMESPLHFHVFHAKSVPNLSQCTNEDEQYVPLLKPAELEPTYTSTTNTAYHV